MTTKGMILDQMVQIFTRKGCHVYACNAFLNHVHILVEIPSPTDFAKIINKVKSSTGVVYRKYPEYADAFEQLVNGRQTYFGNILVTSKILFDEYASWLFSIFFEVAERIELETGEDAYHKRVFGFISEFLLLVWVTVKKLRVYECKVGMLGEKAETGELKRCLAECFRNCDVDLAKKIFLETREKRPDVLMEASDITGELHLCMQIIATAGGRKKSWRNHDFRKRK